MNRRALLIPVLYTVLFLFFTIVFSVFNYPSDRLTERLNGWIGGATRGAITVGDVRLRPPLSLSAGTVLLDTAGGPVGLGKALVRPRLLKYLSGEKAAAVRLENGWMELRLSFAAAPDSWELEVSSLELDLSGLPAELVTLPLTLEGTVTGSMELVSGDASRGVSSGEIRFASGPLQVGGQLLEALGLAPLTVTGVSALATVEDNVVTLRENALEGDLSATARGTVRYSPERPMSSRLDLTVDVTPGQGTRERLMPVFTMLGARPGPDGKVSFRVRGTVGSPSVTM